MIQQNHFTRCKECGDRVDIHACGTCDEAGRDSDCTECEGYWYTIDGGPCDPHDVLCDQCWNDRMR